MAKTDVTAHRLREILAYAPDTGIFVWIRPPSVRVRKGMIAGMIDHYGYRVIGVDGRRYPAHRLAWMYMHGSFPDGMLDHVNGIRDDNRLSNIRLATPAVNSQNQRRARSDNRSCGLLGVLKTYNAINPWRARITLNGKYIHLGCFKTADEAHAAYVSAKRELHQGCTL